MKRPRYYADYLRVKQKFNPDLIAPPQAKPPWDGGEGSEPAAPRYKRRTVEEQIKLAEKRLRSINKDIRGKDAYNT